MYQEDIRWIEGTPLALKIRQIEFIPPHIHDDIVEIIFCLKEMVTFNYEYEQFTLREGEFICVDKDAHYLYDGSDDICISMYIDLNWFKKKYPYITSLLFVCEYTSDSSTPRRKCHDDLKGMLIALLFYLNTHDKNEAGYKKNIISSVEMIIDLFVRDFDIIFFYNPRLKLKPELLKRHHDLMLFLDRHSSEKITLKDMADHFHLSESYISEFMRINLGFRKCLGYWRAYKSEKLLLGTKMNIMEISERCGFSDPKYYYNAFKAWYKCTPKQFRKNYTEKMKSPCLEKELLIDDIYGPLDKIMLDHYMDLFLDPPKKEDL